MDIRIMTNTTTLLCLVLNTYGFIWNLEKLPQISIQFTSSINSVMSIKEYSLTNIFFHLLCSQDSFQKKFTDFEWVLHSDWRNPTLLLPQDFSQVWIFWCLSRFELLLKVFLHSLQLNGFSPVWITWCRISEELRVKDFPHLTHS